MLPVLYERWFTELCGRPSPVESRSTCDDCAMLPGAPALPPEGAFDPAVRCCSYHPHLAPHFVGAILAGDSDAGRDRVRARIAARSGVTPLGLGPPPAYEAAQQRLAGRRGAFGHSHELLCPFYQDARCTIWQHRGAACAAFHCKLDRGALGASLWSLLIVAFNVVERGLARWLLARQGLDATACDALLRAPDDAALTARAWGAWHGREEDYFCSAAQLIEPLTWAEVVALGGRELSRVSDGMRGAVAHLDARARPERVRRNGDVLYHLGAPGRARLQHRAVSLDLLDVPAPVAAQLAALDETRLDDLGLDDALVQQLLDWQVLLPGGS